MASNYLRKTIGDRRTGANLIGINVDTSNMRNLSPMYKEAFNKLEAFATEMDNIKIENEQTKLALDLAKNKLDFEKKYLSDPSVYLNEDKFNAMVAASEKEFRQVGEKLIANSIYLDTNQKNELLGKFNLQYSEMVYKAQGKRNEAYIQQTVDFNRNNIEIAKQLASVDEDNTEMYFDEIKKSYNSMLKTGIFTQENINMNLAKDISDVGIAQLEIKVEKDIINNPNLTIEEKQTKLQEFYSTLTDDEINEFVDGVVKTENMNDDVRKYMTAGMKYRQEVLKNNLNEKMSYYEKKIKTEKKIYEANILEAINNRNPQKLMELTTGEKVSSLDFINNTNGILEKITYGYNEADLGDMDNSVVFPYLTKDFISNINNAIKGNIENGIIGRNSIQPIYDVANELSGGNIFRRNGILKNYAKENKINPWALYKGEQDYDYIIADEILRKGFNYISSHSGYSLPVDKLEGTSFKNYSDLVSNFSKNNIALGKVYADAYIIGTIMNDENLKRNYELSPEFTIKNALERDDRGFEKIKSVSKKAAEFSSHGIRYEYVQLKDPRVNYIKPKEIGNNTNKRKGW